MKNKISFTFSNSMNLQQCVNKLLFNVCDDKFIYVQSQIFPGLGTFFASYLQFFFAE